MGEVWKRQVTVTGKKPNQKLTISHEPGKNKGNPPGRTDGANVIKVRTADRKGGGAKVKYYIGTKGLQLTGVRFAPPTIPAGLSAEVRGAGEMLWLIDKGSAGDVYDYLIMGSYDGASIESPDPEIHNEDE